jgi:F0F1-type ATP synthase assembly protein I
MKQRMNTLMNKALVGMIIGIISCSMVDTSNIALIIGLLALWYAAVQTHLHDVLEEEINNDLYEHSNY